MDGGDRLLPWRWFDRKRPRPTSFKRTIRLQEEYAAKLRKVADEVGRIVKRFPPGDPASLPELRVALQEYSDTLDPWARATAARLSADLNHSDFVQFSKHAKEMQRALVAELRGAPTGAVLNTFLADQVKLIKSLPIKAAERVHELTMRGLEDATRVPEIRDEILRTGHVTRSRATLIARTEIARTASGLTMARAQYVGSDSYIWRTARDSDVRPSHRKMEGKVVQWAKPPTLDNMTGHAGMFPNCRCYPEPIIPDSYD